MRVLNTETLPGIRIFTSEHHVKVINFTMVFTWNILLICKSLYCTEGCRKRTLCWFKLEKSSYEYYFFFIQNGESKPVPSEKRSSIDEKPKKKTLPELDKYWKVVNDDPTDFTGWTYLLQYVDQEVWTTWFRLT